MCVRRQTPSLTHSPCCPSRADDSLNEVVDGLKTYFDRALGNILLYRFERHQYVEMRKTYPDKPASEVYGSEHLLRLFGIGVL